ncbi:MAG: type II secretion system F family protein [Gemmatimonadaceae bacterium]
MSSSFRYRAAGADGRVVEGRLQAGSRRSAIEDLRRQQLFPVDVVEVETTRAGSRGGSLSLDAALAVWTRTIATMLTAGVTLERALSFSSADAGNALLSAATAAVRRDVEGGLSLSGAMRRHPRVFSALYTAMTTAGEESGALDRVLSRLADHLDETAELRARLRSALLYPALMAVVAGIGIIVILMFVVPRFVAMVSDVGGSLPLSTRLLVGMSGLVLRWWWVWMPLILGAVWAVRRWAANPVNRGRWHAARLAIPVIGELERSHTTARFTRTLGLLLKSGIGILPALRIARSAVANIEVGDAIARATDGVSQGKRLSSELIGVLPPLANQLVSVGEESGQLDELCLRAADHYDREVSRKLRTLIGLVEPALILLFGLLVGFVALAMLQAIYSVNASIA